MLFSGFTQGSKSNININLLDRILDLPRMPTRQKRGAQTQTFWVQISSGGVGVFHMKRWESKMFGVSLETQGKPFFSRDIPGLLPGYPRAARKEQSNININFLGRISGGRTPGKAPFSRTRKVYARPFSTAKHREFQT